MTVFYFLLAISLLVVIHEYGHFWVARRCGVFVKRFSVGFGKPLWTFTDKHGTEFSIAPIPLGGYVSMLDEREAEVPAEQLHMAFNRKSPWQRIAIAAAGPAANFIFAIAAYWFLFLSGLSGLVPVVGDVQQDSPAAIAGVQVSDEITAVNGKPTPTWEDVNWQLVSFLGETTDIQLTLTSSDGAHYDVRVGVENWLAVDEIPDPISALGLEPRRFKIPVTLAEVKAGGAAERAGLQAKDTIVAANGQPVESWSSWVELVKHSAEQTMQLTVVRDQQELIVSITPDSQTAEDGTVYGFVGAMVAIPEYPADWVRKRQFGVIDAFGMSLQKTWETTYFTLASFGKILAGQLSVKNLSGPVTIAKVAGATAAGGLESFVGFLALLSVSLGVLNLLPVPVLDGGHIVFSLAEIVRGKPLSEQFQMMAVKVGMFLLIGLMLVAFYNDLSRL